MSDITSLATPAQGIEAHDDLAYLDADGRTRGELIKMATNLRIQHGRWRTRYACHEIPVLDNPAARLWNSLHTQECIWYVPKSGHGPHYLGNGDPRLIESAAGRMFELTPTALGIVVKDLSGGMVAYPHFRLAWLCQAENYVIRTDNRSQTQIWDGKNAVTGTSGYNSSAKERSRFPNAAGPCCYAGGRIWTTLFGRRIYVSDSLHQSDLVNATDLLAFTDQSYDITNLYFSPPASEGDIVALTVSISSGINNSRAQNEVLAMCQNAAVWGVKIGVPREVWATTDMRSTRSVETGATGPNAFEVRDGDILMRTPRGIESLNMVANERGQVGTPVIDLSSPIESLLDLDDEDSLIFASLINPPRWKRMLCTVSPIIEGSRHSHRGWVVGNWNPSGKRNVAMPAWEGVHTMPARMGRVVKFAHAVVAGQTECIAITDKGDAKGIIKLTEREGHDVLEDGTMVPIQWSLETHKLSIGGPYRPMQVGAAFLYLSGIASSVKVSIYYRDNHQRDYQHYRTLEVQSTECAGKTDKTINLGKPTGELKDSRWMQFLIIGEGVCSPDVALSPAKAGAPAEEPDEDCITTTAEPICSNDPFLTAP